MNVVGVVHIVGVVVTQTLGHELGTPALAEMRDENMVEDQHDAGEVHLEVDLEQDPHTVVHHKVDLGAHHMITEVTAKVPVQTDRLDSVM